MKLLYKGLALSAVFALAISCNPSEMNPDNAVPEGMDFAQGDNGRNCYSMKVLERQLKENPGLANRLAAIEKHTNKVFANKAGGNGGGKGKPGGGGGGTGGDGTPFDGTVEIPVVVNVIYSNADENISMAQIQSQIDILNADFSASNNDLNQVPSLFSSSVGDMDIHFTLATVNRKSSNKTSWGTRDAMKSSKRGGIDATDPENNLNIWVCEIGGGILGYAQFPGGSASTDGVVIGPRFFGSTGYVVSPFDEGRTATHEVGHWLNLRHIWGDGGCGVDDFVDDTPLSDGPNYGCPSFPTVRCGTTDQTMNYMDYVDDACMYMFTGGQVDRSRALFASGGVRETFVQ
ncbi:zinc metalloprotease [Jiulongibacter sediminis]|jgi:hypothetical protein|uniref:zinc metalloprotease n=1 Tax=Jiulongibacter sediminis TaxID=1605367 RepID=UPI0026EFCFAD|nr:zinc metalloprotease [Jiulongibacter sediminis]